MSDRLPAPEVLAKDLAADIGFVMLEAGRLELTMGWLYSRLLHSPLGELVAAGQPFELVRQACLAIAKGDFVDAGRQAHVEEAMRLAGTAWQGRNRLVHGHWIGAAAGVYNVSTRRWTSERQVQAWTLREIRSLAVEIHRASDAVAAVAKLFPDPGHPEGDHLDPGHAPSGLEGPSDD